MFSSPRAFFLSSRRYILPRMNRFPILMYHALWPPCDDPAQREALFAADPQLADPGARLYALDERAFKQQLNAISAAGLTTPQTWDELADPKGADKRIALTFDDGHRSNFQLALPSLAWHNLRGIFFITTDWIDKPGFMTRDHLAEMRSKGMLLGTHGCSHAYFSDLDEPALRDELARSKAKLESILGEEVSALALPGGRNKPLVMRLARELGYRHLFTSRIGLAAPDCDPLDWPRVPITHRQPAGFIPDLVKGDTRAVDRMARDARLRELAKRILGNTLYDRLRSKLIRD